MRWIAYWMMAIAVLHCALALIMFGTTYLTFLNQGVVGAVATEGDRLALWFLVAGVLMLLIGYLFMEAGYIPKPAGVILAATGFAGGILLPASGFWLLLPPAAGILLATPKT